MKFKIILVVILISSYFLIGQVLARELDIQTINNYIESYRKYKEVDNLQIAVPTVLEVLFDEEYLELYNFAVLDKADNTFEPYYFKRDVYTNELPISIRLGTISNGDIAGNVVNLFDKNSKTSVDFTLLENNQGRVQFVLSSSQPITSSQFTLFLADHVALPNSVEVRAMVDSQNRIILAKTLMNDRSILFPETTSNQWFIVFTYGQPLRINELYLKQSNARKIGLNSLRFLAQPLHSYKIYYDSDKMTSIPVGEAGNLSNNEGVIALGILTTKKNLAYVIADIDEDGIPDIYDNCVSTKNSNQEDIDNNGRGDDCEDFDKDGLMNIDDNCINNPNRNQQDIDGDGIGDVCDFEESRFTEKYKWIPWVGISFAGIILIILFALVIKSKPFKDINNKDKEKDVENHNDLEK